MNGKIFAACIVIHQPSMSTPKIYSQELKTYSDNKLYQSDKL